MQKFNKVALIGRRHTDGVVETLTTLINHLKDKNIKTVLEEETAKILPNTKLTQINRDELSLNAELLIAVGGDGSMLAAARIAANQKLPVVGINRGKLGFLTDITPNELEKIDQILNGDYCEEERFLLHAKISEQTSTMYEEVALNDIVLLPSEMNRMIEFSVYIDNQLMCDYRADGLIVATPTGSTAHALSGGGPILHPGLDAIVLLPMFSHNLSSRPIVIHGNNNIEIKMSEDCHATPNISCDGHRLIPITDCGKINIKKYTKKLRLIHLTDYNYYDTLRQKLHWGN
ncbi:MAG: NAD(+) kinase [Gammaproteobacteria bacterium]|nr:NAD(+) kinase [Gammaproteobacteria bacterium]